MEILEHLFELQEPIIKFFAVKKEGLPAPPISLTTKTGQVIAKKFIDRVIEELVEFSVAYEEAVNRYNEPQVDKDEMNAIIHEIRMEYADIWHFFIEECAYTEVSIGNIRTFLVQQGKLDSPRAPI